MTAKSFRILAVLLFFCFFCETVFAGEITVDSLLARYDELARLVEPDADKYAREINETHQLLHEAGLKDEAAKCLFYHINYLIMNGVEDAPDMVFEHLKTYQEQNPEIGTQLLYSAWRNLVINHLNRNNFIVAYTTFQALLDHAKARNDYYGLSNAYAALGFISKSSYEAMRFNMELALKYLDMCPDTHSAYYLYYLLASSSYELEKYDETLCYTDTFFTLENRPVGVDEYAYQLRLLSYVKMGEKEKAKELFNFLANKWDKDDIIQIQRSNVALAMCLYLCRYGNPDLINKYIDDIIIERDRLEILTEYYLAKGNFFRAFQLKQRADSIDCEQISENQREQLISSNAFYQNEHLQDENHRLEIEHAHDRATLLIVIIVTLVIFVLIAVFIIRAIKVYNKKLANERNKVELERQHAVLLNEMKTRFLHNMSHEMRTPLNTIIGFNDLLYGQECEFSNEERNEIKQQVNFQTRQLSHLLSSATILSRIDNDDARPVVQNVNIGQIVKEIISEANVNLNSDVKLVIDYDVLNNIILPNDSEFVKIALREVIDNAIKFTQKGSITIKCVQNADKSVDISVSDTGPGISPEKSGHLFTRFEKIGSFKAGFGLGLSCSKEILECIGGTIAFDHAYSEGARFLIHINPLNSAIHPNSKR